MVKDRKYDVYDITEREITLETNFFTIILCKGEGMFLLGDNQINFFPGNVLVAKGNESFIIRRNSVEEPVIVLNFEEEFFDSYTLSLISYYPIFYDMLRLKTSK